MTSPRRNDARRSRRPAAGLTDGSAAGASTARSGSDAVRSRPAGSALRWGLW